MTEVYGLPPPEAPDDTMSVSTMVMIAGLVVAALAFIVVGLGFVLGWWGPNAETEPVAQEQVAEPTVSEPVEPEFAALPGAELMPTVESRPIARDLEVVDPLAGAEPVPEIPPPGRTHASTGGSSGGDATAATNGRDATGNKARPARVRVSFARGHYQHVEIKLGGKVFELDDDRTIDLPPGGYRVELRKAADQPWKPAGLIELQLGHRYRVTLFDPPLAKLEVLE
jgi:hypothetical protein